MRSMDELREYSVDVAEYLEELAKTLRDGVWIATTIKGPSVDLMVSGFGELKITLKTPKYLLHNVYLKQAEIAVDLEVDAL